MVTGPTGLVGSWLIKDLIKAGTDVVALIFDRDSNSELYLSKDIGKVKAVYGQLEDFPMLERLVKQQAIDTVFHLGAQTIVERAQRFPFSTFESNIRGTYNLLEACRIHQNFVQNIIIASSDKAYGEHEKLPYVEDAPLTGRFPYEVSKTCTDLIAQSFYHSYQLPLVVIRCGNIYGGGDLNWSRIVPDTIRSLLQKKNPIIRSDGTYVRDYIYVKDVVQGYMQIAENLKAKTLMGEAFNLGPEKPSNVTQLVKEIQKLMHCEKIKPKILNKAKGEIHSQFLSSKKIAKKIGWRPQYSLQEGLKETIEWYREFLAK